MMKICSSVPHTKIKYYLVISAHASSPQVYKCASLQCGARSHCFELHRSAMLTWDYERYDVQRIFWYIPSMKAILSLLGPSTCPEGYFTISEGIPHELVRDALRLRASLLGDLMPFVMPNIGLSNCHNSCYIDCVLHALFFDGSCKFVNDSIIIPIPVAESAEGAYKRQVHDELVNIANFIQGKWGDDKSCYTITTLRSIFLKQSKCELSQSFASPLQGESMEFLSFILQMFEPRTAVAELIYSVNGGVSRIVKTIPVVMIDSSKLLDGIDLGSAASTVTELTDGKICLSQTVSSTFLVFFVNRLSIDENMKRVRDCSKIIAPSRVYKHLKLCAVIVHSGSHYTTYMNKGQQWHIYDDTASPIIQKHDEYPREIETHGILYFYSK